MATNRTSIQLTAVYEGESYSLETFEGEYRNLMVMLADKIYIEDYGECKGMGRCGTCVVKMENHNGPLTTLDRNEESTIRKMCKDGTDLRLACQILVDESLGDTIVHITN